MERITEKQLEAVVERLNRLTHSPLASWIKSDEGHRANIGNYHLDYAYGYVSLARMVNGGGGIEKILPGGTKRECYEQLQAFIRGINSIKAWG